ncbi:hypothetical protein, partial [Planktotalea sp.]|uniref:hypothetical protein n=1 Tax=Planktotalea sp. TaxID=2029877 RepID=UPI00329738E7
TSIDFVRIHRGMNGFMEREVPVVEMFSHSNIRSLASALSGRTRDDTANRAQKRRTRLQNIRKRA